MPQIHTIWNNQVVDLAALTAAAGGTLTPGEPVDALVSAAINNTTFNSAKLHVRYESVLPADVLGSFWILAEMDYKDALGNWRLLPIYQGNALRKSDQPPERVMVLQPNVAPQNLGEVESQFRGPKEVCQISRAQGQLSDSQIRCRLVIIEDSPGGTAAFSSVTVSAQLELYTV